MPGALKLFADGEPPGYINSGKAQLFFGCTETGYLGTFDSEDSPGGTTQFVFTDTASPCFTTGTLPDNQDTLDGLTEQFGKDFLGWMRTQFDYVFDGVVNVQTNGFIDEIEFDHSSDICKTRINSAPWNGHAVNLGHNDSNCPAGPGLTLSLGVTTETITARSGNNFGSGKVQLFDIITPKAAAAGSIITIKNWFSTQIISGKYVIIGKIGCLYFLVSSDC